MKPEEAEKILEEAVAKLSEHFESVLILGTWRTEGVTRGRFRGAGNVYAQQGMAREFLDQDAAALQAEEIAHRMEPPTDESDGWKASV